MKRNCLLIFLVLLGARVLAQNELGFIAYLHGLNEVPPSGSSFAGVGSFTLQGNQLEYDVKVSFLDHPAFFFIPSGAGVFGPASRTENAPKVFDWPTFTLGRPIPPPGPVPIQYVLWVEYTGVETLTPEQTAQLTNGLWYINIDSTNNPHGELRGQICPLLPDCDCDGDGVSNKDDFCPDTPPGEAVDAGGCSIEELCPCDGPWKDHKQYVLAVRDQAFRFWKDGRIDVHARNAIVKQAEASSCGTSSVTASRHK